LALSRSYKPVLSEISLDSFYSKLQGNWRQGEHIALIGPTGTGKTTIAHSLLEHRDYVCVLAVKEHDDTLERFKHGPEYDKSRYKVIKKFPPDYPTRRVVLWIKPRSIVDREDQSTKIYHALNLMYLQGGWCIYFDEAGYIAGNLGLSGALGILLNQGRSSYISVVATVTRPHSMIARVPVETMNQCRHLIVFKYTDIEKDGKACAQIAGINSREMEHYMRALAYHPAKNGQRFSDFLYIYEQTVLIVRNEGETVQPEWRKI